MDSIFLFTHPLLYQFIEDKINQLIKVMNSNIERRLQALEKKLDLHSESIAETIEKTLVAHKNQNQGRHYLLKQDLIAAANGSKWVYGFVFLGILFTVFFCLLWRKISNGGGGAMGILGQRKKSWND